MPLQAPAGFDPLAHVMGGGTLTAAQAAAVFGRIMDGGWPQVRLAALLGAISARGPRVEEILGAARAMRERVTKVPARARPLLDTCGTGGSGIARRNVSTAVAIVAAACGAFVAKHGNRAASSRSGSADVLEALGVCVDAPPEVVARCIDRVGVGFLFARTLHPAMAHAAPVRKALGVRTIFNLLGPLTNPAGAVRQAMGVYDPARVVQIAEVLGRLGAERALVVHGFDAGVAAAPDAPAGIDDASLAGETLVAEVRGGKVETWVLRPEDVGLSRRPFSALRGGDPPENARALCDLLAGRGAAAYREAVVLSGALALLAATGAERGDLPRFAARIDEAMASGAAAEVLARLVEESRRPPA